MNATLTSLVEHLEHEEALEEFARQTASAGLRPARAERIIRAYAAALRTHERPAWIAFYLSLHEELAALAEAPLQRTGARDGVESLLLILDDDFGAALVTAAERRRIRARFVE